MQQIRWGIIGCGQVTEIKSGPAFQKAENSALIAVMRRTGDLAQDYAKRHNVPYWYDDAQALIDNAEVDAVYIATHPDTHYQYAKLVALAGKPVYCEKPLAMNHAQSQALVSLYKEKHLPGFCAYYRRALPKYCMIKKLLSEQIIGDIRHVHIQMHQKMLDIDKTGTAPWRVQPQISGGGLFMDVGSHALDLIDFFFGPINQAQGDARNQSGKYEADDLVFGHFCTDSGITGTGLWCFNTYKNEDTTTFYGSEGELSYSVLDVASPITIRTKSEMKTIPVPNPPTHVAQPLIQTVVNALLKTGSCPSTLESASRTDWVLQCMQRR